MTYDVTMEVRCRLPGLDALSEDGTVALLASAVAEVQRSLGTEPVVAIEADWLGVIISFEAGTAAGAQARSEGLLTALRRAAPMEPPEFAMVVRVVDRALTGGGDPLTA